MRKALLAALFLVAAVSLAAAAEPANVAGNWTVTLKAGSGDRIFHYTIVQNGEKLSITRVDERGEELKASGTIVGNAVEWTLTRETQQGPLTFFYNGTVEADTMQGTAKTPRGSREWSGARAAAK